MLGQDETGVLLDQKKGRLLKTKSQNASGIVTRDNLQNLVDALVKRGYTVVGPLMKDGAIVYDEIRSIEELPEGWTDEQDGGFYRLKRRKDKALFGYVVGPHSWKRFLYPPRERLFTAKRNGAGFETLPEDRKPPRYAFLGVRSCELHALSVQDKVFMGGDYVDPGYKARRERAFIVAVNCGQAASTCFCVSMNTGPEARQGYDLVLTEIIKGEAHDFLIEAGSAVGQEILKGLPKKSVGDSHRRAAENVVKKAIQDIRRRMDTKDIKELLYRNLEHPRWEDVAKRCLTCANCTLVCPTCFCSTVEDVTDLKGENVERWRKWDSCFTGDFSYIHGGSVRGSTLSRYRQWMTHKLATWIDQFGTSGCVGCGRCITWCPVGIDLTEEVRAIRKSDLAKEKHHGKKNS